MKVVAFNGSPHKHGNTYCALKTVCGQLEKSGIKTEIIWAGGREIRACTGCNMCQRNPDEKCIFPGDPVNEWIQQMKQADGILLGSPVHYAGIAADFKAFLDRAFRVCGYSGSLLRHKVGAAVVAVRRSGGMTALDGLYHYLSYSEMLLPTSNYWNIVYGRTPGQAMKDGEGLQIMEILGRNMAWLMKLKAFGEAAVIPPPMVEKVYTNLIQ